jgi:hypothetical protein
MSLEPDVEQARIRLAQCALAILSGTISFVEGARQITALRTQAKLDDFDPDIIPFVVIDSETDALPLGQVRALWASDALAKLQPEIDAAEKWARDTGIKYCLSLVERFKPRD